MAKTSSAKKAPAVRKGNGPAAKMVPIKTAKVGMKTKGKC